jgi:hypothetical protein
MAERNGDGIVYRRSDCSEGNVRFYGFDGEGPGSKCGTWELSNYQIRYIHEHPEVNHRIEDLRNI